MPSILRVIDRINRFQRQRGGDIQEDLGPQPIRADRSAVEARLDRDRGVARSPCLPVVRDRPGKIAFNVRNVKKRAHLAVIVPAVSRSLKRDVNPRPAPNPPVFERSLRRPCAPAPHFGDP